MESSNANKQASNYTSDDVAIIGMAGFFPKATDLKTFWQNIVGNVSCIEEIPANRWDWRLYYHPDQKMKDKVISKWGAFLPDVLFDPLKFGIPPKSLAHIETTQLLMLESTRQALADSGYLDRSFNRKRTAVYIGTGASEADLGQYYSFRSMLPRFFGESSSEILSELDQHVPDWSEDSFPGILLNIVAGRVANRFDLGGANCTLDAACASSLAALRAGILDLKAGESDMVIVGGADTLMSPFVYNCFTTVGALSPTGKSQPFDRDADGIVLGETIAAIIIKRLRDAEKDGDKIYAVIKGMSASSDGKAKGLTAPRKEGQLLALERAYENAHVDPETVGLIEAHGTGTVLGDMTEAGALKQFFNVNGRKEKTCAIGSVKSMIGHSKCAAGIAGIIKTAIALDQKVLPPTLGVKNPLPEFNSPDNGLYLNIQARPWITNGKQPRRAGVNSFGFGGTNFHTVLEEYVSENTASQPGNALLQDWPTELFIFRGVDRSDVIGHTIPLHTALKNGTNAPLKDLSFSQMTQNSGQGKACLTIVASSVTDLREKLETALLVLKDTEDKEIWKPSGIYYCETPPTGKVAFVFPGQGSQYTGMLNDLTIHHAPVRKLFERFDTYLADVLPRPLSSHIFPPKAFSPEDRKADETALTATNIAQPAMGNANLAILDLLKGFGITPDMTAGHSYGEYTALFAAGVMDEKALAKISEARGRFILEAAGSEPGTMAAVKASEKEVAAIINDIPDVWIANLNSPEQTVISGTRAGIKQAVEKISKSGFAARSIPVACAFHSPIVSHAGESLKAFFSRFDFQSPRLPVYANTTAGKFPDTLDDIQDLLIKQLVSPVRFVDQIKAMYEDGARIFVEVGAGNVLSNLIDKILAKKPHKAIYTDKKGISGLTQLQHALARISALGIDLDLNNLYINRVCQKLDLANLAVDGHHPTPPKTACFVGSAGTIPLNRKTKEPVTPRPICFQDKIIRENTQKPNITVLNDTQFQSQTLIDYSGDTMSNASQRTNQPVQDSMQRNAAHDSVINKFQDLMSQFLDTQKSIMLAYLNGGDSPRQFMGQVSDQDAGQAASEFQTGHESNPFATDFQGYTHPEHFQENIPEKNTADLHAVVAPEPGPAADMPTQPEPVKIQAPLPAEAAPDVSQKPAIDIQAILLRIVSDRTGYPEDMLEMDLEIQADLGIDSIKRVQVLEELEAELKSYQLQVPDESIQSLAESFTLGEIVENLQSIIGNTAPPSDNGQTAADNSAMPADASAPADITPVLLNIVSDLCGYPPDTLELDLEIEADLGIDSIKRVQIMEHLDNDLEKAGIFLQDDQKETLAGSVTLGDIINTLNSYAKASSAPAPAVMDITPVLLNIVSDLCGYPPDTLELDLEIEADLGIDSIKRVQIMEHLDNDLEKTGILLRDDQKETLAGSVTLGDIINTLNGFAKASSSPAHTPLEQTSPREEVMEKAPDPSEAVRREETPSAVKTTPEEQKEITTRLYHLIEKETGYPSEVLEPDLNLLNDLEIDAQKKDEILDIFLASLEDIHGNKLTPNQQQAHKINLLKDIVDWVTDAMSGMSGTLSMAPAPALRRFTLTPKESPLVHNPVSHFNRHPVLVTHSADNPLTDGVVEKLQSSGYRTLILEHGQHTGNKSDTHVTADLTDYDQLKEVIGTLKEKHGKITGLIHLIPVSGKPAFDDMAIADWQGRLALETKSLFYLTKILADDLTEAALNGEAGIVAATAMGGLFASMDATDNPPTFFPGHGAISGYMKALAGEFHGINARVIDIDPMETSQDHIAQITTEFVTPSADIEVGYRSSRRFILDIKEAAIDEKGKDTPEALEIGSDWNILITGGGRGISSTIAREIAEQFKPTCLLVGRTPFDENKKEDPETAGITDEKELKAILAKRLKSQQAVVKPMDIEKVYTRLIRMREIRESLENLRQTGAKAFYFDSDVKDEARMKTLMDTLYDTYGNIDGVIHGAGIIEDKMIRDKDIRSFDRVFDTKADSIFILSRVLRKDTLRFMALFSSVAGRFGNPGQSDYGAANEVYNKSALYLNRIWPGRVVSFIWGPWESSGGMVTEELRKKFDTTGIYMIPRAEGARAFVQEITQGPGTDVEVVYGSWDDRKKNLMTSMRTERLPLFSFNSNFNPPLDGTVELVRRLELSRDIYLLDHKLDGTPVLPMAIAMEMMVEAVTFRYPDFQVRSVENLKVLKGVILKQDQEHIRIVVTPVKKADTHILLKVQIRDIESEKRLYYEAMVELVKESNALQEHTPITLQESGPFSLSVAEAYDKQLFHGPLWQGIESIETIGKNGIIGRLKPSRPEKFIQGATSAQDWIIDPLVVDSGLQLILLWMRDQFDMTPLPSQLRKYIRIGNTRSDGPLRCEIQVNPNNGKGIKEAEVFFINPDGRLFGKIEGLEIIGSKALNRLAEKK